MRRALAAILLSGWCLLPVAAPAAATTAGGPSTAHGAQSRRAVAATTPTGARSPGGSGRGAAALTGTPRTTRDASPHAPALTSGLRATRGTGATTATNPEAPIPVAPSVIPPVGRRLSPDEVLQIADRLPKLRRERAHYRGSYGGAYLKGPGRWQVSYFSRKGKEIGQVIIADATGRVLEQWTGFQIAWTMARGYPGAFGRHVNALYIWLPLCVLFLLPFVDWRRPFALLHLDLLALLSFSVSLAFFNHGNIYASVPLTYPPLLYLLARMLTLVGFRGGNRSPEHTARAQIDPTGRPPQERASPSAAGPQEQSSPSAASPQEQSSPSAAPPAARRELPHLLIPPGWLAIGVVFLIGFRIGLNVTDANVIDVGYAGVIGAQRIVDGAPLYGGYPANNEHGDTYGPVNYEAYVPFERIFGWSGTWDDLPAAHAAAIVFDLLAVGLLFLLGLRIRGPTFGVVLAYAWVSYPFTLYALQSDSNDTLVAVLVLAAVLCATSPPARGLFAALAGLTKFAPLALVPLLASAGLRELPVQRRPRALAAFVGAFAVTVAVVSIPALAHDTLREIYERTIAYQANRGSPFSVWGLYGHPPALRALQKAVQLAAVALALVLAVVPRRRGGSPIPGLAAAAAAILIALQLGIEHWFYLYIPWFFPLVMIALLAPRGDVRSPAVVVDAASESARSSPLAVA